MEKQNLGEIISSNRKKKGLTQKTLAEQLNVTDKAVSKWERNVARPDINTIPKLAEVLEVPAEDLISIPISTRVKETSVDEVKETSSLDTKQTESTQYHLEAYKERVRRLLVKGLVGFTVGFLFALIMAVSDGEPFNIGFGILVGIGLAGVPYGWELMELIFGRWSVVGHIGIMLIVFMLKVTAAVLIGWIAYPIALLYNAIRSQKKGSKLKIVFCVLLAIIIAWLLILFGVIKFNGNTEKIINNNALSTYADSAYVEDTPAEETIAAKEIQYVTDETLITASDLFREIVNKAGKYVLAKENEARESNYEIVISSSLKAAYFLSGANSEEKYYDFGTGTYVNNAILVVGHYNVNIANTSPRDEWVISVFPNFVIDANGKPSYDETSEYCEYLQANSLEDVYTWMCKEYEGMTMVPLDIPIG